MNAGVLQRGLCRQVGPIQGGEVESLLLDFERPRGEQSNPLATVVADVILTCDTERGPGLPLDAGQPYHLCIRSLIVPCTLVDDRAEGGVEVSEERESKGRQEEARAKQGLGILYARGEAEDRLGDVKQRDIPRELRERFWMRKAADAGIERRTWTVGISMPRWIERHELGRTRNEPGDGFRYVYRRGTDGAGSRAEWFEVTEEFAGVEAKDIEAFMRVNNGGTAGSDFEPDRFVRGLEMGTPGRKAQQRAADKVIAAVEKKVSKASYERMWRRHGYGTLIVGLPLWFAANPADPLRVENVIDDFTTRVRIGLEPYARQLKKRSCPFWRIVVVWVPSLESVREWQGQVRDLRRSGVPTDRRSAGQVAIDDACVVEFDGQAGGGPGGRRKGGGMELIHSCGVPEEAKRGSQPAAPPGCRSVEAGARR